jgi:hypothetical protein
MVLKHEAWQNDCNSYNLQITVQEARICKGWMGKPKGMLQVLWEHGFISETNI